MVYNSKDCKTIIELKNICFGYEINKQILKNVSLQIKENEYVCIIGHNGSGKSTISKIISGLFKQQSGHIYYKTTQINKHNAYLLHDNIGVIFQNPDNQFVGLTVEDDIAFGLENKKVAPENMWPIINNVANQIGISNLLKLNSVMLSGGQKQKVAIASVLALNPDVFIFDEATSMLDPKGKNEIKNLMIFLRDKCNKTIISITHDMEEVKNANRVIVMSDGEIKLMGTPFEIFSHQYEIQQFNLDVPFACKMSSLLNKNNPKIKLTLDDDELIKNIYEAK